MNLPMLKGKPVIRCSSLDQLISCPGSRTLLEVLGALREDKEDSWEGSWCHWKAAGTLIAEHGAIGPEGGLPYPDIPKDYQPKDFAQWIVDYYLRTVLQDAGSEMAIEVESEMLMEFENFWLSGHCDISAVNADATKLLFSDLKSGINPVDAAESNWQIFGYAVLFKRQWDSLREITGTIIQPRLSEDVGKRESRLFIKEDGCWDDEGQKVSNITIDGIASFLEGHINAALQNSNLLRSGQKQCRWCDAWLKCPAIREEIKAMKEVIITQEMLKKLKETPDDQALGEICVAGKLLGSKFEDAKKMVKARLDVVKLITLEDGTRIFQIEVAGTREIFKVQEAWEVLAELLEPEVAYSLMSIAVEDTEKAIAKHFKIPHKSEKADKMDGRKKFMELIGGSMRRKPQQHLQIV